MWPVVQLHKEKMFRSRIVKVFAGWTVQILAPLLGFLGVGRVYPHLLYEAVQPLNKYLEKRDWRTLICYMNCITEVKPGSRTILIVREIINFEHESLYECLKALEGYKENSEFSYNFRNFGFFVVRCAFCQKIKITVPTICHQYLGTQLLCKWLGFLIWIALLTFRTQAF